jgi:hypothetical protein
MQKLEDDMATLAEAVQGWRDYTAALQQQRDAAVAALDEANSRAQSAADALAAFQADDAATDAQQLADQAQADADFVQGALNDVQNPVVPPPVIDEPITDTPSE